MKFITLLASFLGVAAALESSGPESRVTRMHKRSTRPEMITSIKMRTPEFKTTISAPTEKRSTAALTKVSGLQQRSSTLQARDFYECTNPELRPSVEDCNTIVSEVLSTDDPIIIAANSCLTYTFGTCQGFFCSLCETFETTTQNIGTQLDNVVALCVENGQPGTIVGEDAPQWEAGFTYAGQGLPTYDVC
ncbi:hypothetical protein C7999DRAFT_34550 [Corynascus novoguineensis]|uniref:Uncharacterized protein n=1 Tax=Corynascus novoguineensis TaxID=1126955 RepID=A0AAN7HME9_9PEZI|nr:hypothetical protein C7999DRAFT_34550 [Corynascus novoguineensis]